MLVSIGLEIHFGIHLQVGGTVELAGSLISGPQFGLAIHHRPTALDMWRWDSTCRSHSRVTGHFLTSIFHLLYQLICGLSIALLKSWMYFQMFFCWFFFLSAKWKAEISSFQVGGQQRKWLILFSSLNRESAQYFYINWP